MAERKEIDEIKARCTAEDVARYCGKEPKSGFITLRDEKTPSVKLYSDHYHDYGDQSHGDVISLWMRITGDNFRTALKKMGDWLGVPIDTDTLQEWTRETETRKDRIQTTQRKAAQECRMLAEKNEGLSRDIADEEASKGYAQAAAIFRRQSEVELTGDLMEDEHNAELMISTIRIFGGESGREDADNLTEELTGIRPTKPDPDDKDKPVFVDLDKIPDEDDSKFLWYPYIPMQEVTILAAPGGTGKGMLFTLLAARLSTGTGLSDMEDETCPERQRELKDGEKAVTLILSKEDGARRIKPRFLVSGGFSPYLKIVDDTLYDSNQKEFLLRFNIGTDEGCAELERWIRDCKPKMVVLDPITSFMPGKRLNNGDDTRTVLSNLTRLARITNTAIIAVTHTRKGSKDDVAMTDLIAGSHEIKDVARSVLMIGYDIEDDRAIDDFDYKTPRRLVYHLKSNHAIVGKTVRYYIAEGNNKQGGGRFPTNDLFPKFSDVTAEVLERTPHGILPALHWKKLKAEREARRKDAGTTIPSRVWAGLAAMMDAMNETGKTEYKIGYQQFENENGGNVWSGSHKQGADLTKCLPLLMRHGFTIQTGKSINGKEKGFTLLKILNSVEE